MTQYNEIPTNLFKKIQTTHNAKRNIINEKLLSSIQREPKIFFSKTPHKNTNQTAISKYEDISEIGRRKVRMLRKDIFLNETLFGKTLPKVNDKFWKLNSIYPSSRNKTMNVSKQNSFKKNKFIRDDDNYNIKNNSKSVISNKVIDGNFIKLPKIKQDVNKTKELIYFVKTLLSTK